MKNNKYNAYIENIENSVKNSQNRPSLRKSKVKNESETKKTE